MSDSVARRREGGEAHWGGRARPLDAERARSVPSGAGEDAPVEAQLVEMCAELLEPNAVAVTDDLIELGVGTQRAARLLAEIEERFGQKLSLDVLLQNPTVRDLAKVIRRRVGAGDRSSLVAIQPHGSHPPFFAVPPSASPELVYGLLARYVGKHQPFFGLKPPVPDGRRPPTGWYVSTAAHYLESIRRIQPSGPYYLGGRCFGAFVAYEMAQQLARQGERVALLAFLDASPPLTRGLRFYARRWKVGARFRLRNLRRSLDGRPPIEYAMIPNHHMRFDLVYASKRESANYDQLVWDANLRAAAEYVMRPYAGPITLIQSRSFDDPDHLGRSWAELAGGGLDYHTVSGGHVDMLREPDVRVVAAKLAACLERARDRVSTEPVSS